MTGIHGWHENTAELEFLIETSEGMIPIKVKAGVNTKAKSLKVFKEKYHPPRSLLLSGLPISYQKSGHSHIPLYLACQLPELLQAD